MMLADTEHVEADLVGELCFLQEVAHPLLGADHVPVQRVFLQFREGVDPDLHGDKNTLPWRVPESLVGNLHLRTRSEA